MTDKWQCVKCKEVKIQSVSLDSNGAITKEDIPKIMCHCHMMRNLTEGSYVSEKNINDSGARDDNPYRG